MHNWDEKQIKIPYGSYKQIKSLNKILQEDDFENVKIMDAIIINEIYTTVKKLKKKDRHDFLLGLAADNLAQIENKKFTKQQIRGLGTVGS